MSLLLLGNSALDVRLIILNFKGSVKISGFVNQCYYILAYKESKCVFTNKDERFPVLLCYYSVTQNIYQNYYFYLKCPFTCQQAWNCLLKLIIQSSTYTR